MSTTVPSIRDVDVRRVGLGALCVAAVALTLVAQLVWIVAFDETGLDRAVPDAVFTIFLPALSLALVPAVVARSVSGRRAAVVAGGVVLVGAAALGAYTITLFGLCGRPC